MTNSEEKKPDNNDMKKGLHCYFHNRSACFLCLTNIQEFTMSPCGSYNRNIILLPKRYAGSSMLP